MMNISSSFRILIAGLIIYQAAAQEPCGNCDEPHRGSGCESPTCEGFVCNAMNNYCCTIEWGAMCVEYAKSGCPNCKIFVNDPTCADETCRNAVFTIQPDCSLMWYEWCTSIAQGTTSHGSLPGCDDCTQDCGNCGEQHAGPGCLNPACETQVCQSEQSCCFLSGGDPGSWDLQCVDLAIELCDVCLPPEEGCGNCGEERPGDVGCSNTACAEQICQPFIWPSCCDPIWGWDSYCVQLATVGDVLLGIQPCEACSGPSSPPDCALIGACLQNLCASPGYEECCVTWTPDCTVAVETPTLIPGCEACLPLPPPCPPTPPRPPDCVTCACREAVCEVEPQCCIVWDDAIYGCNFIAFGMSTYGPLPGCEACTGAQPPPPQITCPEVDITVNAIYGACVATVPYSVSVNDCPGLTTERDFPVGTTTVSYSAEGSPGIQCSFNVVVKDDEDPTAVCALGTNPAGDTKPDKNAGFFVADGNDNCGVAKIEVVDSVSGHHFTDITAGTTFKYTEAPGAAIKQQTGSGDVDYKLTGNGPAYVLVTDESGNTKTADCDGSPISVRHLRQSS